MEHEAADHEDRHPGGIAEGDQAGAGEELADDVDLTQGPGVSAAGLLQGSAQRDFKKIGAGAGIEEQAGAHEDGGADLFEGGKDDEQESGDQRDEDEGQLVAAGDDTVVDLQHV